MERYIHQLIEDIRKAGLNLKPPHEIWNKADVDNEAELEDLSHVEKYIYGEEIPVSLITGIEANMLPPENRLTEKQRALLAEELEKLLELKHFALDFPDKLPNHRRYKFIRKFWNDSHVELSFGTNHIEFCQYEPENCPYPDYCQCKEYQDIYDSDADDEGISGSKFDDPENDFPF